jgi:hypothetical protein
MNPIVVFIMEGAEEEFWSTALDSIMGSIPYRPVIGDRIATLPNSPTLPLKIVDIEHHFCGAYGDNHRILVTCRPIGVRRGKK